MRTPVRPGVYLFNFYLLKLHQRGVMIYEHFICYKQSLNQMWTTKGIDFYEMKEIIFLLTTEIFAIESP